MNIMIILALISLFFIFYAMVGYPVLLIVLDKIFHPNILECNNEYEPTVTYMIVAHNEEDVIEKKLDNTMLLDYAKDKLQILVTLDNCTDNTLAIVNSFINRHSESNFLVHTTKEHKGKTNAQNEAQQKATGEILVMTDANSMLEINAIKELVSSFSSDNILYVCGRLVYSKADSLTADSESTYWNLDLRMRDIESRFYTITAGNGAIYACRTSQYIAYDPIQCHDSAMPFDYGMQGKRAVFNPKAIAVEKTGNTNEAELKRKIRMNRNILSFIKNGIKAMFSKGHAKFSFFYFGHRTCRYLLWFWHLVFLILSIITAVKGNIVAVCIFIAQLIWILLTAIGINHSIKITPLRLLAYYGMTVYAQLVGAVKEILGLSKPTWSSAEGTR